MDKSAKISRKSFRKELFSRSSIKKFRKQFSLDPSKLSQSNIQRCSNIKEEGQEISVISGEKYDEASSENEELDRSQTTSSASMADNYLDATQEENFNPLHRGSVSLLDMSVIGGTYTDLNKEQKFYFQTNSIDECPSDDEEAAAIWKSGVCSFFSVEGEIVAGHGLIARDKSGTSDPYVKVKLRQKCVYKSKIVYRNLNPTWNEAFQLAVDDVNTELVFKVYDFDRLSHDDDMGEASVNLGSLEINKDNEMKLPLINKQGLQEDLGKIVVKLSIIPKTPSEKIELAQLLSSAKKVSRLGGSKGQIWDSLLSVILVKGKDLKAMDSTGFSDPYVRFKLGNDKYKSKVCKQTLSPAWHEQFDMKMFTGNGPMPTLEVTVWDKDSGKDEFMGRTSVDLSDLEAEKSHYLELGLEDQPATICLYVSITAQSLPGCSSDLQTYEEDPDKAQDIKSDYSLLNTAKSFKQIGWLQLKLHRAVGLAVADLGGASDPFAVIELGNQRLVTPTIYKTLNPQWDKIYELIVYDIHDVIEITVFDEDKRGAPEFLGRVRIPLLSITSWEKRLYQLKDKRLQCQAKGHLIMSLAVVYNPIRASIRTFNPKEDRILDETPRFRRQLLQQNVDRLTNLIRSIIATGEFIQSLFTWKYKLRSAFAFSIYILLVMNFDWFMLPLILFLVLLKNYIVFMLSPNRQNQDDEAQTVEDDDDDDDDDDKPKKGRAKTFREKLEAINNICMLVQNHMDNVASFGERIKNTFNWTIPFLSYLLMVILLLGTIVLYMVPLRYLLLAWGINKFTKRIRKPNAIPNNELLDFLSRIPSDPEVKRRRPFKADSVLR
ncbi:multiple C2 and transmembrane domain-containing protein 1-like isoform X1 [Hydractinia symbiolongicarpus]|uniref:multiple C2 and transmembrane domain-containing protein 1-like isoform X1 n=1 Tax=Hydractinia symbiolongicarpus TaxID=13093 RepID=UPI00254A703C|nr:multiple C2 and transmembrane domain-containing protein 1-like isoform X1 [Hydractinia symbiolongicarpus]